MTKERAPKWKRVYSDNRATIGKNPNLIKPGQRLKMPDGSTHLVRKGETLSGIAGGGGRAKAKAMPQMTKKTEFQPARGVIKDIGPTPGTIGPRPPTDTSHKGIHSGPFMPGPRPPDRIVPMRPGRPAPVQEDKSKPGFGKPVPIPGRKPAPPQPIRNYPMRAPKPRG